MQIKGFILSWFLSKSNKQTLYIWKKSPWSNNSNKEAEIQNRIIWIVKVVRKIKYLTFWLKIAAKSFRQPIEDTTLELQLLNKPEIRFSVLQIFVIYNVDVQTPTKKHLRRFQFKQMQQSTQKSLASKQQQNLDQQNQLLSLMNEMKLLNPMKLLKMTTKLLNPMRLVKMTMKLVKMTTKLVKMM